MNPIKSRFWQALTHPVGKEEKFFSTMILIFWAICIGTLILEEYLVMFK